MLITLLSIVITLAAILLIAVVFIQNPKGGGISNDFGSVAQLGGVKQTTEFIHKLTWGLVGTIAICSILITMQQPKPQSADGKAKAQKQENTSQPAKGSKK